MIVYYKLFRYLCVRGYRRTYLLRVISPPTLAKLGKNGNVQTCVIDKICILLMCQPSDIMEFVPDSEIDN